MACGDFEHLSTTSFTGRVTANRQTSARCHDDRVVSHALQCGTSCVLGPCSKTSLISGLLLYVGRYYRFPCALADGTANVRRRTGRLLSERVQHRKPSRVFDGGGR